MLAEIDMRFVGPAALTSGASCVTLLALICNFFYDGGIVGDGRGNGCSGGGASGFAASGEA